MVKHRHKPKPTKWYRGYLINTELKPKKAEWHKKEEGKIEKVRDTKT
jgi:hypothetical protein